MGIKEITNEIIKDIEDVKAILIEQICSEDIFMNMDPNTCRALQKSLKLINESCDLMKEYATILESQDKKLDMILEKLEERA